MSTSRLSKRYNRNLQMFEQHWQARVDSDGYAQTRQMSNWYQPDMLFDDAAALSHKEPMVCVKMSESSLHEMCGVLAEHHKHDQLQARYPQLREAYVSYLSMLHLTADHEEES